MYYFDSNFLKSYIDQKVDLKVFVDDQWYQITSLSDLEDSVVGIGTDVYGGVHRFDYREIDKIQASNKILTIDTLQTKMTGVEPSKEKTSSTKEEPTDAKEPPKEKEPDLSWYSPQFNLGHLILSEVRKEKK